MALKARLSKCKGIVRITFAAQPFEAFHSNSIGEGFERGFHGFTIIKETITCSSRIFESDRRIINKKVIVCNDYLLAYHNRNRIVIYGTCTPYK
jgi:hypothetical protein